MFDEFKKITIKGGYFEQPTEFRHRSAIRGFLYMD